MRTYSDYGIYVRVFSCTEQTEKHLTFDCRVAKIKFTREIRSSLMPELRMFARKSKNGEKS